ncbi:MAG TPA: stage II sporulation protein M [Thermoanaerobaculia bacterium]|nr:stage II sporulation protein M [Thermoanaerobaculia bacterium]
MDYAAFLALREPDWLDFERRLTAAQQKPREVGYEDLEELAIGYRQILHDNALAAARFPGTGASRRLQKLAIVATRWLHRPHRDRSSWFLRFWRVDFPRAFRANRQNTAAAVYVFLVAAAFGLGLAAMETSLATVLLGERSVSDLTNGHLWTESLVTAVPPAVSSSAIARNNLGVALVGWAGGALAGIGSLYILFLNGFLLGAVFGVTMHFSMERPLAEFVSAHGPLELTLIIVTAGAGLRMGRALLEATDAPRREALESAGRDGLTILLGCLPWFVPLGLIEGFVSPSSEVPAGLKAVIGVSLVALFLIAAGNPFLKGEDK